MDLDRNGSDDNNDKDDNDDDGTDQGVTENILNPGQKIALDDFQLNTVIGRGSFGKVYLVRKKDTVVLLNLSSGLITLFSFTLR